MVARFEALIADVGEVRRPCASSSGTSTASRAATAPAAPSRVATVALMARSLPGLGAVRVRRSYSASLGAQPHVASMRRISPVKAPYHNGTCHRHGGVHGCRG